MTFLADTSVWSLLLRRDAPPAVPEVAALVRAIERGDRVATTGLIVQELLQGRVPPRIREAIVDRFRALLYVEPTRDDHIAAADLSNTLRSSGVQAGTVDALIAHLAISRGFVLLTTDGDFQHIARHSDLEVWSADE